MFVLMYFILSLDTMYFELYPMPIICLIPSLLDFFMT